MYFRLRNGKVFDVQDYRKRTDFRVCVQKNNTSFKTQNVYFCFY